MLPAYPFETFRDAHITNAASGPREAFHAQLFSGVYTPDAADHAVMLENRHAAKDLAADYIATTLRPAQAAGVMLTRLRVLPDLTAATAADVRAMVDWHAVLAEAGEQPRFAFVSPVVAALKRQFRSQSVLANDYLDGLACGESTNSFWAIYDRQPVVPAIRSRYVLPAAPRPGPSVMRLMSYRSGAMQPPQEAYGAVPLEWADYARFWHGVYTNITLTIGVDEAVHLADCLFARR